MKRWLVFLFLFSLTFVFASIEVSDSEIKNEYLPFEEIEGVVNLTIEGEGYSEVIVLSDERELELGVFLESIGADFECSPSGCLMGYLASSGVKDKSVPLLSMEQEYLGFFLEGEDVVLSGIEFNISSDFEKGSIRPLNIEFFESESWGFSEFSDEFLSKDWGCFSPSLMQHGPIIGSSFYCEMISLGASDVFRVGAELEGSGGELEMVVYPEDGFGSWDCTFNPAIEDGCIVEADGGQEFSAGKYQICIGSDQSSTGYNIFQDEVGVNCGFPYSQGPGSSVKDYAIFAQSVKYADADDMGEVDFGDNYVDVANAFISEKYGGDCSDGCILPLKISGVEQNLRVYDINLIYTERGEIKSSDLIYDLQDDPAEVDFDGALDLSLFGLIVSETGEYFAELSGEDIFREYIELLPAPIISSVFPMDPPAGVPVTFYANVDFGENTSLSYVWDFGDNRSINTMIPSVPYTYNELGEHTLTLSVSAGGNLTSESSFEIEVINPEVAVEAGLKVWGNSLATVRNSIESLPDWYGTTLMGMLEVASFEDELARIEAEWNNSFDAEDFRDVAVNLYALNIPVLVATDSYDIPFLDSEIGDVQIEPVGIIAGSVSEGTDEVYAEPILTWQNENIDVEMKRWIVSVSYLNDEEKGVLSAYSFDVTSRADEESYFVINKPFGDLYFNGDAGARKAGDSTVIVLKAGESKKFDFYYKDVTNAGFFVSPRLSSIIVEADIDTTCNRNFICEEDAGENYDNCRTDCKPVGKAVVFFILGFLFFLVIYTGLQLWY